LCSLLPACAALGCINKKIDSCFFLNVPGSSLSGIQRSHDGDPGLESCWAAPVTRTGEPSPARCGPVASSRRRGGGRKGAPARSRTCARLCRICTAQYRSLFRLAVLLTGDAAEPWCWTPLPRCTACGSARSGGRRLAAPAVTAGGRSGPAGHHHLRDGSRRPPAGAGLPAAPALRTRHRGRRLGRDPGSAHAASQREAIVLTSCPAISQHQPRISTS
jgi:hypothetical protein